MDDTDDVAYCGVGIRGVSMAIDSVVWFALMFVAIFSVASFTTGIETTSTGMNADLTGGPAAMGLVLWLVLSVGYHTVLEWRYGKTIGKRLVNIEVRSDDGSSPTFGAALVRNLLRFVDFLPTLYALGIVLAVLSDRNKRLGDRLGGTVVVQP